MTRLFGRLVAGALTMTILAVLPGSASAATRLLTSTVSGSGTTAAACHRGVATTAPGVVTRTVRMPVLGLVSARLSGGRGDWDLAVFDRATRRLVGASSSVGSTELAQGFAFADRDLLVQVCRGDRAAGTPRLTVTATETGPADPTYAPRLVEVAADGPAAARRLDALGLDLTEHGGDGHLQLVLHSAREEAALRGAGFAPRTIVADLVQRARDNAAATRAFRAATPRSGLPSGRTDYRHLADYETEMKALAAAHPGLVKLITLPHKSLEGRTILGIEVGKDVNVETGKPTFVQLGVHHAREWPSGEHVMEYAHELVNGFGKDARITRLVNASRTLLVPVVNVDGFNLSREAPVDIGGPAAAANLPDEVNQQLPIEDPAYLASLLADQTLGTFAYKRRNCRITDGAVPAEGECAKAENRTLGTDPNRNYGALWGGPGADLDPTSDIYRGAAPFSEPETQNVRELVSARQATALITNHTFSNLILRPPGVRAQGAPPDEDQLRALSDAMAAQNGYASIPGYQLYDTTGSTEDWSYDATGGFGYTFEIGSEQFHPPFPEVVGEYEGTGAHAGKGNRAAYLLAHEAAIDRAQHSVLTGRAPKGTTLRIAKDFTTQTSPVISDAEGTTSPPISFPDRVESTLQVGSSGTFAWHVNPSTRPSRARDRITTEVADAPTEERDISSPSPVLPGLPKFVEFQVPAAAARQFRVSISSPVPVDDYDLYVYEGEADPDHVVGSSASAESQEVVVIDNPVVGRTYIAEIRNFSAVGPVDGKIQFLPAKAGSEVVEKARKEAYTLTCERPAGTVLRTTKVQVDRGRSVNLGSVCSTAPAVGKSPLKLSLALDRRRLDRAITHGLRSRVRCSVTCSAIVRMTVDGATARRLKLSSRGRTVIVARSARKQRMRGSRTLTVRFTKRARTALRKVGRNRSVRFTVLVAATDGQRRKVSRSIRVTLRR